LQVSPATSLINSENDTSVVVKQDSQLSKDSFIKSVEVSMAQISDDSIIIVKNNDHAHKLDLSESINVAMANDTFTLNNQSMASVNDMPSQMNITKMECVPEGNNQSEHENSMADPDELEEHINKLQAGLDDYLANQN